MRGAHGVVAAGHRLTAGAGAAVLGAGGTAHDAAIAAIAMACVCEPVLCSPGGTGFAMIRADGDPVRLFDFFAQTPIERADVAGAAPIDADFGTATQSFHIGPDTTATPGLVAGIETLHRVGASRPLAELFEPAVRAARDGVVVTAFQHHLSTVVRSILTATPGVRALFAPGGDVCAEGDVFRNPGLGDALETIAAEGFVGSPVGRACVAKQAGRGHLTEADLVRYRTIERPPLTVELDGAMVHLNPMPAASGVLVAHSIGHLESSDPVDLARALWATDRARRESGGALSGLRTVPLRPRGTTHVSVIDANRTAIAVTLSNGEGNGELVDGFGFMLNNILGEDDVNGVGLDGWPPDTRLSSMMCPTIVEGPDGGLIALGSGGSNRIRSAIVRVLTQLCLDRADVRSAVDAPRLHVERDHLDFEDHFPSAVREELRRLFPDHRPWPAPDLFYGGVHVARQLPDGSFSGAGDGRRDGACVVVG